MYITRVVIFCLWQLLTQAYLQFALIRIPNKNTAHRIGKISCMNSLPVEHVTFQNSNNEEEDSEEDSQEDEKESDNYEQICYEKDISYAIKLYHKDIEYLMSMDLTIPISWLKGQKCKISSTGKKCTRAEESLGDRIAEIEKKIQGMLKKHSEHIESKKKKTEQLALIEGSTEVVKGIMEKMEDLTFTTRDVGRLARLSDILLIGLGLMDENHQILLRQTNFINATKISPNINYLCDGAISLRFDENSESSFLKQMIQVSQSAKNQKYVTIYIGDNSTIMIGDMSVKHSSEGFSGIAWIQTEQDENYGRLAKMKAISLTQSGTDYRKEINVSVSTVFTISSSSIQIPESILNHIKNKFFKSKNCTVEESTLYLQCHHLADTDLEREINFQFESMSIGIPVKNLVLSSSHKIYRLNIKQSMNDKFLVLGEPMFFKYMMVLDYSANRIGVTTLSSKPFQPIISVVTLLRFVIWALLISSICFYLVCCFICVSNPLERCKKILSQGHFGGHFSMHPSLYRPKKYSPLDEDIDSKEKSEVQIS